MSYSNYELWKTRPLASEPVISIIIPAYNESERIIPTIGAVAHHVSSLDVPWELLVADDGSTDDTVQIVNELGLANVHVLVAEQNGGKGSAVRRGMLAARGRYLLFTDADNSTPAEEIDKLLRHVQEDGYDIAVGSRAAVGAETRNKSGLRHLLSNGLNLLVRSLLGIHIKDTQCGFKLYRRDAGKRLHAAQTLMGFSFDLELLFLASKWGYRVAEVPVTWYDAMGSTVNSSKEVFRFLRDIAIIRWTDWTGGYANA